MKRIFLFLVCLTSLAAPVFSVERVTIQGRDLVEPDGKGANVLASGGGEDLIFGGTEDRYIFLTVPATVYVYSGSTSDAGWVVAWGLDASRNAIVDSVAIASGAVSVFSKKFYRVNAMEFHDDSTNVAVIEAYSQMGVPLARIAARQGQSLQAIYTLPNDLSRIREAVARITYARHSSADGKIQGEVAILARPTGGSFKKVDQVLISTNGEAYQVDMVWPCPDWPGIGPGTDLRVAVGLTAALTAALDVGVKLDLTLDSGSGPCGGASP